MQLNDILPLFQAGFSLIPIRPKDKKPYLKWDDYKTRRATWGEIENWLKAWPDMNIAVVTGAVSGNLGIVDIDDTNAIDTLKSYGTLPSTVTSVTGKGLHIWYKMPEGVHITNKAGFINGIDFRGEAGYVIVPPSVHPSGAVYSWHTPPTKTVEVMPQWLIQLLENPPRKEKRINDEEPAQTVANLIVQAKAGDVSKDAPLKYWQKCFSEEIERLGSTTSNRNATLNEVTLKVFGLFYGFLGSEYSRQLDVTESQVEDVIFSTAQKLRAYDSANNHFTDDEIRKTMNSAKSAAARSPRPLPDFSINDMIPMSKPKERAKRVAQGGTIIDERYFINELNQTCYLGEKKDFIIAEFFARIITEITDEDNERYYEVQVINRDGEDNTGIIAAKEFSEDRKLKAFLENLAGAAYPIHPGMAKHLNTVIKLSSTEITQRARYHRTGWVPTGELILPNSHEHIICDIPARKLPYQWCATEADPTAMGKVIRCLIESVGPHRTLPAVLYLLMAPVAYPMNWRNRRFGFFIKGRTGNLKTSFVKAAMCMYGKDFIHDSSLIKWGEGATRNAMMQMAAATWDMPICFDNFKPNTGAGPRDFVNLIHNIIEGGEKDRLNKNSKLQESKDLYAWPLCTGEDVPDNDPASLARLLVSEFDYKADGWNSNLAYVQEHVEDLHSAGASWIKWITSGADGHIERLRDDFGKHVKAWGELIQERFPAMVNANRVGMNVAQLFVIFELAKLHPVFGSVFAEFEEEFALGIEQILKTMVEATSNALEAQRFIDTLRELIAAKRVYVLHKDNDQRRTAELTTIAGQYGQFERVYQNTVGYWDAAALYLVPSLARAAVERYTGKEGLNGISNRALFAQLMGLGLVLRTGADRTTSLIKIDGKALRCIVLKRKEILEPKTDDELL